jgi:hypothetical protein
MRFDIYFAVRVSDLDCYLCSFVTGAKARNTSELVYISCTHLKNAAYALLQETKKRMEI